MSSTSPRSSFAAARCATAAAGGARRSWSGAAMCVAHPLDPASCIHCARTSACPSPTIYRRPGVASPSQSRIFSTRIAVVSRTVSSVWSEATRNAAAYASFRRASNAATMPSPGVASGSARCAQASGPGTETRCAPTASASPFAVAAPMRKPVYDPGPLDTATAVRSVAAMPAYRSVSAIIGTSCASCARARRRVSWATMRPSRHAATLHASVAVSRARMFNELPHES